MEWCCTTLMRDIPTTRLVAFCICDITSTVGKLNFNFNPRVIFGKIRCSYLEYAYKLFIWTPNIAEPVIIHTSQNLYHAFFVHTIFGVKVLTFGSKAYIYKESTRDLTWAHNAIIQTPQNCPDWPTQGEQRTCFRRQKKHFNNNNNEKSYSHYLLLWTRS